MGSYLIITKSDHKMIALMIDSNKPPPSLKRNPRNTNESSQVQETGKREPSSMGEVEALGTTIVEAFEGACPLGADPRKKFRRD